MSDDTTKKTTENSQETAQEEVKEQVEVVEETTPEVTEEAAETSDESEIAEVETPEVENPAKEKETKIPEFRAGDTVRVHYKIIEGGKVRIQPYEGIVISRRGEGMSKTFIVRRIGADNIGVERIFPLYSPNIEKIEVKKRGKVRRAKLYYLRTKKGREAMRIKEVK